jgi:hypothetical protein
VEQPEGRISLYLQGIARNEAIFAGVVSPAATCYLRPPLPGWAPHTKASFGCCRYVCNVRLSVADRRFSPPHDCNGSGAHIKRSCRAVLKSKNVEYAVGLLHSIRFFRTFGAASNKKLRTNLRQSATWMLFGKKRECVVAQVTQAIDSRRLLLFTCTESAEEPIGVQCDTSPWFANSRLRAQKVIC